MSDNTWEWRDRASPLQAGLSDLHVRVTSRNRPLSDMQGGLRMSVVLMPRTTATATVFEASRAFLRRDAFEPSTRSAYAATLDLLISQVGADTAVDAISERDVSILLDQWQAKAATTFNRHRAALLSFFGWCL